MNFIDETSQDLLMLIKADFSSMVGGDLTHQIILDWMHFRARLIPQRQRRVFVSPEVASLTAAYPAIDRLRSALEAGEDVSPWLSERVRKQRSNPTADLMFNDWQISHFHLGQLFERPNRVGPRPHGKPLLFAHIKADQATFLDVQPHGSWTMQNLLRILRDTSPTDLPEIKGVISSRNGPPTDEQLSNLRQNGYNGFIELDGRTYFSPGLGICSSRHAVRLSRHADHLAITLRNLRKALAENRLPPRVQTLLSNTLGLPIRLGLKLESGCFVIYEKIRGINFGVLRALE